MEERLNKLISFMKEIEKFKTIERQCWTSNLNRNESDADHSWHLAMSLILFEKDLPKDLDFNKMLKFALMHDLVEIYTGDTFAFDFEGRKNKKEKEKIAAEKLFSQLPNDLKEDLQTLFKEYEERKTKESKIVNSLDKIQPIIQNLCSEGKSWKKYDLDYKKINTYKREHMEHDKLILNIYEKLLKEAVDKKLLKE